MTRQRLSILMVIGMFLTTSLVGSMAQREQPERQPVQTQEETIAELPKEIIGKDGAPMVLIPAGEFQMGTDLEEMENATPRHEVYLDAFSLSSLRPPCLCGEIFPV